MPKSKKMVCIDGNAAASHVAYAFSEVAAIYPITPSSPMGENAEAWAAAGRKNMWGKKLEIIEMQSEAGAAGAVHGSLVAGALTTTFTASQGLLLMIPNMFKIAGEMLPTVFHVSARSLAAQSLSIFGDHSDVMSTRSTGFAMTAAANVQETMDMALVAHLSTLEAEVPFLAFFDGFRTSHEIQKVEEISYEDMYSLVDEKYVKRFRERAQRPENPKIRVASQNEDVYFQGRETVNSFYDKVPTIVQKYMDKVSKLTGRPLHLFDYYGDKEATDVVIVMGSAVDTFRLTVDALCKKGKKVGVLAIHLYRPFDVSAFTKALPKTTKRIAVLDRTKEPGSLGEPLYQDVITALLKEGKTDIKVYGGRYGLSSKDFPPSHANAVYKFLSSKSVHHDFTVGINDDVTNKSIPITEDIDTTPKDVVSCMFWGLGSDGTVGANKNSIKIIGDSTTKNVQAYFAYDSKKSGGITISHLRFGDSSLNMPFLIDKADFVACHNSAYIGRYDMLTPLKKGGVFLLNSTVDATEVFYHFTKNEQEQIINKKIKLYVMDAEKISRAVGLGSKINTVMQAAFFKISGVLPEKEAIELMKAYAKKTFARKGDDVVQKNWNAIDKAGEALHQVKVPAKVDPKKVYVPKPLLDKNVKGFAKDIMLPIMHLKGNDIPVSKMSYDGSVPSATSCFEKRGVASYVPVWMSENCIQCGICSQSCPHAAIRTKQIDPAETKNAPSTFKTIKSNTKNDRNLDYRVQVYAEDCQGCNVCVEACPAKNKALKMVPLQEARDAGENQNEKFFSSCKENVTDGALENTIKGLQFKQPLFEFSGACAGCGETPYVKLVSQICGERAIIANATGCSSIYSGTFPSMPYCKRPDGRGPAWGNSLFEDNAEYGLGMRLAVDSNRELLKSKIEEFMTLGCKKELEASFKKNLELWNVKSEEAIDAQKKTIELLSDCVKTCKDLSKEKKAIRDKIVELQDYLTEKSVWIIGGDGWAYDIGYGGVDHVVASGKNINILVLDTEVYSNTGGQASKSTPIGAVAKFATNGKAVTKKNLGLMCMSYGHAYVASISLGANRMQAQKALQEAESYNGPSIVFCYAPCINHGIDMSKSQVEMARAVDSGYWPLYRFDPRNKDGEKFVWECKEPQSSYRDFITSEVRYSSLKKTNPEHAEELYQKAEEDAKRRMDLYKKFLTV